jgi:hypothetical protein
MKHDYTEWEARSGHKWYSAQCRRCFKSIIYPFDFRNDDECPGVYIDKWEPKK